MVPQRHIPARTRAAWQGISLQIPNFTADLGWERTPPELAHRDVAGVSVDAQDRVYLFTRHPDLVMIYERDGTFIKAWGEGIFTMAHGLTVGPDGRVFCVDNMDHSIRVFTPDGELLMTLGTPGEPSDTGYVMKDHIEVHRCECIGIRAVRSTVVRTSPWRRTVISTSPTVIAIAACITSRPMAN